MKKKATPIEQKISASEWRILPALSNMQQMGLLFLLVLVLYGNTVKNGYALDDGIVITNNPYTQKGFAGIGDLFTKDSFSEVAGGNGELTGGRYRPLSLVSFAIEVALFGKNTPGISHAINLLLYGLLCLVLLKLLQRLIPERKELVFLSLIVFAVHPLHTEVVANIKSRDELMCFLFLGLSLFVYFNEKYPVLQRLLLSSTLFFLSLLSKENGITFIAVVPLLQFFFLKKDWKLALASAWPFLLVTMLFFVLRYTVVGLHVAASKEVLNAPYLLASGPERIATQVVVLGRYLVMLLWPDPLSYDYSYPQVAYVGLSHPAFIISLLAYVLLGVYALNALVKRELFAFAISYFLITLSIVSNLLIDVGSPMNERFLFQPSLGFALVVAALLVQLSAQRRMILPIRALLLLALLLSSVSVIARNSAWKDDFTLFTTDVEHAPNSAKTNCHAGVVWLKRATEEKDSLSRKAAFDESIRYLRRAAELYPAYTDPYLNLGNVYAQLGQLDSAYAALSFVQKRIPTHPVLLQNMRYLAQQYLARGVSRYNGKQLDAAIADTRSALACDSTASMGWYNLGGYYLDAQRLEEAKAAWEQALRLDPGNASIKKGLDFVSLSFANKQHSGDRK